MGNGGASVLSLEEGVGYLLSCISNWFNIYIYIYIYHEYKSKSLERGKSNFLSGEMESNMCVEGGGSLF